MSEAWVHGLGLWRNRWMAAGLPVIPIEANRKTPLFAWQSMPSSAQWYAAGGDQFRGNLAVILGNHIGVIDCDNPEAISNTLAFLDGKGIVAPRVVTPSGGLHVYLKIAGEPANVTYALLSPEVGKGELRVSSCYVVAPCSVISNNWYRFEYGNPEQIAAMVAVQWQDLCEILPNRLLSKTIKALPVRLVHRGMPSRAAELFELLRDADQGDHVDAYFSRSEAESAIVAVLVLAGWDLSEIEHAFDAQLPAHYADHKQRKQYLERTYRKALGWIACVPERMQLAALYHKASEFAWHGRGGLLALAVYRAILAIGYQYATLTPSASVRDIAEHASASPSGVRGGIARLLKKGYLSKSPNRAILHGAQWQINPDTPQFAPINHSIKGYGVTSADGNTCKVFADDAEGVDNERPIDCNSDLAELWGQSCLGRSAYAVYLRLSDTGKSISELSKSTGKAWQTVKSALARLELHDLADQREVLWFRGSGSAPQVASDFEAERMAKRRHQRHEREREAWRERMVSRS